MKFIAVLALLVVCASADVFPRQPSVDAICLDQTVTTFMNESVPAFCYDPSTTQAEFCVDECAGRICTFYTNNKYSAFCAGRIAALCFLANSTPPASCQRCNDENVYAEITSRPPSCNQANFNPQDFCTDECGGAGCAFYKENKQYPEDCLASAALFCTDAGLTAPTACGALALVTMKEVTEIILLVAAFLIF